MQISEIETPRLLLNKKTFEKNILRMRRHIEGLQCSLRPHLKTTKSYEVAKCILNNMESPITVSTLKEADYFAEHGVRDILYAVGIAQNKLNHVAALIHKGVQLTIIVDSFQSASLVSEFALKAKVNIPVLIEVDVDGHRSGVAPNSQALIDIANKLHRSPYTTLSGIMSHAGSSYDCESIQEIKQLANHERELTVSSASLLRNAGLPCPTVSIGSTPTALSYENLDGVTEVRAGVYAFFDLVMAGLGVCTIDDIAISVLATVISHQQDRGYVIVDAGWMALSRDRGTANQAIDQGYGLVQDEKGHLFNDVIVIKTNQEHGILALRDGGVLDIARFPIGSRVRILPNHACATGAQHQSYLMIDNNGSVLHEWSRFNGW